MAWVGDLQAMRVLALALAVAAAVLLVILRRQAGALGAAQAGAAGARAEAQAAGLRAADATARLDGLTRRLDDLGDEALLYSDVLDPGTGGGPNGPLLHAIYFWRVDNALLAAVGLGTEDDELRAIVDDMDARAH